MSQHKWHGQKILVVDDSVTIRENLTNIYMQLGLQVVGHAVNGVDALAKIRDLQPDLVSLDIIMPEMDGIECYRKIQQIENKPRCFIVSWLGNENRVIAALGPTIPSHLINAKPATPEKLSRALDLVFDPPAVTALPKPTESAEIEDLSKINLDIAS